MDANDLPLLSIPLVAIVGGFVVAIFSMWQRGRMRELAHRERLAMINKGLVPSPEADPERFEELTGQAVGYVDRLAERRVLRRRASGVMLVGLGLGLAVLIGFAGGEANVGVGVGGAIALLGVAFLISSALEFRYLRTLPPPPPGRPESDRPADAPLT